jgi:hypothetical protein
MTIFRRNGTARRIESTARSHVHSAHVRACERPCRQKSESTSLLGSLHEIPEHCAHQTNVNSTVSASDSFVAMRRRPAYVCVRFCRRVISRRRRCHVVTFGDSIFIASPYACCEDRHSLAPRFRRRHFVRRLEAAAAAEVKRQAATAHGPLRMNAAMPRSLARPWRMPASARSPTFDIRRVSRPDS